MYKELLNLHAKCLFILFVGPKFIKVILDHHSIQIIRLFLCVLFLMIYKFILDGDTA